MSDEEKKVSSDLDDAVDSMARLASGLAGKVFQAQDPEAKPVVNIELRLLCINKFTR